MLAICSQCGGAFNWRASKGRRLAEAACPRCHQPQALRQASRQVPAEWRSDHPHTAAYLAGVEVATHGLPPAHWKVNERFREALTPAFLAGYATVKPVSRPQR